MAAPPYLSNIELINKEIEDGIELDIQNAIDYVQRKRLCRKLEDGFLQRLNEAVEKSNKEVVIGAGWVFLQIAIWIAVLLFSFVL